MTASEAPGDRLDSVLARRGLARSRTHAARLLSDGLVTVNGVGVVKASARVGEWDDVAVAGLCLTYDGEPFSPLPELMARAEEVVKLTAVCTVCGADAAFHIRLVDDGADARRATAAQVGGGESYRARCRAHRDPAAREPRRLR